MTKLQKTSTTPRKPRQPRAKAALAIPERKGKLGQVLKLLSRPEGASIADLMAATNWQAHSVRGVLSGAIKKKLGLAVTSEKSGAERIYRVSGEADA